MKRHILTIAALLLSCPFASGRVTAFPLTTEIRMLARQVQWYHEEKGVYPESWAEVESHFGPMKSRAGFDPAKRLVFVTENVRASAYMTESRIIFISREPFRPPATRDFPVFHGYYKTVGVRGYMAAIADGGEVYLQHISPQYAAQLFENAGVDLPAPSGLGLYPHERAHRAKMIVWWVVLVVVIVLMVRAVLRRKSRRRIVTTWNEAKANPGSVRFLSLNFRELESGMEQPAFDALVQRMERLERIELNWYPWKSLGSELSRLPRLVEVRVMNSILDEFPWSEWRAPERLRILALRGTDIRSIPPAISRFTGLQRLDLHHNQLTEVPEELLELRNIRTMNLMCNPLGLEIKGRLKARFGRRVALSPEKDHDERGDHR